MIGSLAKEYVSSLPPQTLASGVKVEGSPDSSSDSSNEVEILTVKKPPKKIVPLKKSPTPSDPVVEAVKEEGAATEPGLDGVTITQESESLTLEAAKEKTVLEGEAQGPLETALEASLVPSTRQIGEGQTDVILSTTTVTHPLCS